MRILDYNSVLCRCLLVCVGVSLSFRGTYAIPYPRDPLARNATTSVKKYLQQRTDLITEERNLRFDAGAIHNATKQELKAMEIVDTIRFREQQEVWRRDSNKEPGMPFLRAKDTIIRTELFKIIRKMPKGALLHAHLDGMCDASYLLQLALEYPRIHIRTASGLNGSSPFPTPNLLALPDTLVQQNTNNALLTSSDYIPNTWVSVQRARDGFPSELGGKDGFDQWIVNSLRINAEEAYIQYNTTTTIWAKFDQTFSVALGLTRYQPIFKRYTEQLLLSQVEDGISHVELRVGRGISSDLLSEDGAQNLTMANVMENIQDAIDNVRANLIAQGRKDEFLGAKASTSVIYMALRAVSVEEMTENLNECLELKAKYPDLMAGFDMAGQEDPGHPLIFFAEPLLNFRAEANKRGLDIPFIFHAGETLDDGGEVDSNLYDAFLLGSKRIGHGYSLAKHPLLMKKYKEHNIAAEVCPISNEILRLTGSVRMHPLPDLLNNGLRVALSSDDPSVFQNYGLSFDFFQVIAASNITNLLSLGQLARQSIEYSLLDKKKKDQALKSWESRWTSFVDDIVAGGSQL
ncbi:hypothetical protein FRC09_009362 [Ceratobasidium sp. 395]|nr:hypothetical protein FRC09_009362 [Ceratobasidium sp. 395]